MLFGGAAGGGKSFFLLAAALQFVDFPEYRALIVRRTFSQLAIAEGLLDIADEWLTGQAHGYASVDGKATKYKFSSGAELHFGHCQHLKDRENYQGGAYHFVGFDELTQFLLAQYRYIAFSRQRRRMASVIPIRVRSTSNPGGEGHQWVKQRLITEATNIDEAPASLVNHARAFVPSKLRDNPHIDADDYETSLNELHPHEKAQLMDGDWDARPPGALFHREWFEKFTTRPGKVRRRIRYWDLAATEEKEGKDPDWSVGTRYESLFNASVDYLVADVKRQRKKPGPLETWIREVAIADGVEVEIHIEQEGGASGKIAARALARELEGFTVRFHRPTGSKVVRSGPVASAAHQGRVGVLLGPWYGEWIDELEDFDGSDKGHDDQVDSLSGAHATLGVKAGTTWDDLYPPEADEGG